MTSTQKNKHGLLWSLLLLIVFLGLALVIVPPIISINNIKPKIEEAILNQTGIHAEIQGDINFSLLGKATIVAHKISVPNGTISSVEFTIPFFDIFDIKNADISGEISVNGASLHIEKIVPFNINKNIVINNSKIQFLNKEYNIVHANMSKNEIDAFVRTNQHKYDIKSIGNKFIIKNKNNKLNLIGELFKNGTAKGHISIIAQDINRWFEFETPHIEGQFPITADVSWDGEYGIKFDNLTAQNVHGSIEYKNDGYKIIKLTSNNANFDMTFFMKDPSILQNASFNLDFYGDMTFMKQKINHFVLDTVGSKEQININKVIADNIQIIGGTIDENGAHDVYISGPLSGLHTTCLFNGTPTDWSCKEYSHGNNITSVFSVKNDVIDADVYSTAIYADMKPFVVTIRKLASSGEVRFYYPDMEGTLHLKKDSYTVDYTRLDNRTLNQAKIDLKFLPDFMKDEPGDLVWIDNVMIFTPNSKQWQLSKNTDFFLLRGENFKKLTQKLDLQVLTVLPYVIYGNYKQKDISNLTVEVGRQNFTGSASMNSITLKTDSLNFDALISQEYKDNFEQLSFFVQHPIMVLFGTGVQLSISADSFIFNNQKYNNFLYSLKNNSQTFSISDSNKGNLLTHIIKNNSMYNIDIQLNKFEIDEKLLPEYMPLNISNSIITADIKLKTNGKIARDFIENMEGTLNMTFEDGILYGLGFEEFYASAQNITDRQIAEYALSNAFQGGITPIKKLHLIGTYNNGDIQTTSPLTLSMKHVDAVGQMEIINDQMSANLQLVLRGTDSEPKPIELKIYPNGEREYYLNEIMQHFDVGYMHSFINSHDKF